MPASITINGMTLAELGLRLPDVEPWFGGVGVSFPTVALPGATGMVLGTVGTPQARRLRFTVATRVSTFAERVAALDRLAHQLVGLLEVVFPDAPDRVMLGVYAGDAAAARSPKFVNVDGALQVEVLCVDAAKYEAEPRVLVLSTSRVQVPLGTLPSGGQVWLMGGLSGSRSIIYRAPSGITLGTLTVSGTLSSTERLVLSLDDRTITKVTSAQVATDAYSWKSASTAWFTMDPGDGDPDRDEWGTLELSSGTGLLYYRKGWGN